VDGIESVHVGTTQIGDSASVTLKNMKSFGRVSVVSPEIEADIDLVPPPAEWETLPEDVQKFSHVNLKLHHIALSEAANGILGCTMRLKVDSEGRAITSAYDKDGAGVLDAPVSAYKVADLTDSSFPLYSEEWANEVN